MKNKILYLTVIMVLFNSCRSDHQELLEPDEPEFISISDSPELQNIKSDLRQDNLINHNGREQANVSDIIEAADWTKVRKLVDQVNEYDAYGMVLDIETGDYLNNLVIFSQDDKLYPYLFSFNPSEQWKNDLIFQTENPLDGEVRLTSLFTGKAYYSGKSETSNLGRTNSECCNTVLIKKNNNEIIYDALGNPIDIIAKPATYVRIILCGECNDSSGGDGTNDDWIDGIVDDGSGGGGDAPSDDSDEPKIPVVDEKPCEGDPVKNPKIASQKTSGTEGGMHGCTRYGKTCNENSRTKWHDGIDIENSYGDPVYAMYSGIIYNSLYQSQGFGYWTQIQSTVNGQTIITQYAHLKKEGRVTSGKVKAGQVIGYQGDSGNLKGAIEQGTTVSHVHIGVLKHDGSNSWNYNDNFTEVDPRDWLSTTIDDNGNSKTTDCN